MERRKAEESREVKEHLQRHITKWESMKEELSLLQRGKELQDNELHRLRKGKLRSWRFIGKPERDR
jgi:hypothetical protein